MQASKVALNYALAEAKKSDDRDVVDSPKETSQEDGAGDDVEDGEIQEVDMEAQAEGIRTVFSDPKNFNVTVRICSTCPRISELTLTRRCPANAHALLLCLASSCFDLDPMVRLSYDKKPQPTSNAHRDFPSSDAATSDSWSCCCNGLDGGHQASDQPRQRRSFLGVWKAL